MTALKNSARNAFKHGLCSNLFLAEENAGHISEIREELIRIYKPKIDEEERLINDLAFAQFKCFHNDYLLDSRRKEELYHAGAIYDFQRQDEYVRFKALWQENPVDYQRNMFGDFFGTEHFLKQWSDIAALAEAEKGTISLNQAFEACMMLASAWKIQDLTNQARHLMGLFLACSHNPEELINIWVERSGSDCREMILTIAHEIYAMAPSMQAARSELAGLAREQIQMLERRHQSAKHQFESGRILFVSKSCGQGLGDKIRTNEARLFHRYYTADQNRADKLEKRLAILKRNRARHSQADAQDIAYNARYMNTQSYVEESPDYTEYPVCQQDPAPEPPHEEIKPVPVPEPVAPKYSLNELENMMREALRERISEQMGVSIVPPVYIPVDEEAEVKPKYHHVNWSNKFKVTEEESNNLQKISTMEEGPKQDELVKQYFGTHKAMMVAYNAYFLTPIRPH